MWTQEKGYKGMAMEGFIAEWYARNTGRDLRRFTSGAQRVAERVADGGAVLEVAPGPGYLAIALAKMGRHHVTGLDISHSFVRMARENAALAGVAIGFHQGDAAEMPFADGSFDYVVCMAAFKNFAQPLAALNEIHRVLRPGGSASIHDLRKEASREAIDAEVATMRLSRVNAALTRWTFRSMLLRNAYARDAIERLARESRFGGCAIAEEGIGFELRLHKA